jgi:hypothetical protein
MPAQHANPGVVHAQHIKPVVVHAQHVKPVVVHAQHIKPVVCSLLDVYTLYTLPNVGEPGSCHHFILQMQDLLAIALHFNCKTFLQL